MRLLGQTLKALSDETRLEMLALLVRHGGRRARWPESPASAFPD